MNTYDTAFFVGLETAVWEALRTGDAAADRAALSDDFLGVYPSGFDDRAGHVGQLADGPTVAWYEIGQARILIVADGHVLLSYRAQYRRANDPATSVMYVSSLWSSVDGAWRNVFSQDTPDGDADSVV